nr:flagellar hook-associated protein FlgK [Pradoshia eiseniae]
MMTSTFHGLETAKRGLVAQQTALSVVGHNIANANTLGYSRQRVNQTAGAAYPSPGLNRAQMAGQLGTGVQAESIQRIRDHFLDAQYRNESSKLGYYGTAHNVMTEIEGVMNELDDTGLANSIDTFWQSLQDLAANSVNAGAKAIVRERGIALAGTFNYLSESLQMVRSNLESELQVTVKEINGLLEGIDNLNKQIDLVEPNGALPNDLYDARDNLIDELSGKLSIKVEYVSNGGNASAQAAGTAVIHFLNGTESTTTLVDKAGYSVISVTQAGDDSAVDTVIIGDSAIAASDFVSKGKLLAMMEGYGYMDADGNVKGEVTDMMQELDQMAFIFATEFNKVHKAGLSVNEISYGNTDTLFFSEEDGGSEPADAKGFAGRIQVADAIIDSIDNLATATTSSPIKGDGANVLNLANVIYAEFNYKDAGGNDSPTVEKSSLIGYLQKVIGEMGGKTQTADRLSSNSETLLQSVLDKRSSVSGVSLDEEMTNLVQFQQAYNASARMVTLLDECLDRIINGLGLGGR